MPIPDLETAVKRDPSLKAPFTGEPQPFLDTERRYGGIQWLSPKVAMVSDFSSQSTRARTWVIDPSLPDGGTPRPLYDFNIEDRINQPGNLLYQYDAASDRQLPIISPDGRYFYLTGPGASKDKESRFTVWPSRMRGSGPDIRSSKSTN